MKESCIIIFLGLQFVDINFAKQKLKTIVHPVAIFEASAAGRFNWGVRFGVTILFKFTSTI